MPFALEEEEMPLDFIVAGRISLSASSSSSFKSVSSRPRAERVSRFACLMESYTAFFKTRMCAPVMVSALLITGTTVVFPCKVLNTCKSRFSSSPP